MQSLSVLTAWFLFVRFSHVTSLHLSVDRNLHDLLLSSICVLKAMSLSSCFCLLCVAAGMLKATPLAFVTGVSL